MSSHVSYNNDQQFAAPYGATVNQNFVVYHSPVTFTKEFNNSYPQSNNNCGGGALSPKVVELSKPYETSDVLRYSERNKQYFSNSNNTADHENHSNDSKNYINRQNGSADLLLWFEEKRKRSQNSATIV
uniref:Uncharacterized protein n=1 Tax=Romanomermis culicivorax TaxID=13658 RepID=A0A915IID4_ROMCU